MKHLSLQSKGLDLRLIKIITFVMVFVTAFARVTEYKYFYRYRSGLLADEYFISVVAFAFVGLVLVIFAAICYKDSVLYGEFVFSSNIPAGILDVISAVIMIPGTIHLGKTWYEYKAGLRLAESTTETTFIFPMAILSCVMILFVIVCAIDRFSGKNMMYSQPILSLIPVLWGIMFLLYNFVHNSLFIVRIENYYVIFTCVAILFACLAFVRNYASFGDTARVRLIYIGCPAAVILSLGYSLSDLYLRFIGFQRQKTLDYSIILLFLAAGIFFAVVLCTYKFEELPPPVKASKNKK
ncbi:MAG: hypothetical protein Q4C42_03960 [Clostridia bacterium]|nr:hypothetical protein [Clostridia bacterium]